MAKRKLPTLFGPKQSSRIEDMSWKGPTLQKGGPKAIGSITKGGGSFTHKVARPGTISETELQKRLRKVEKDAGGIKSLVTNVGDNTYEWTEEYTWIAYASDITNASAEGVITSQAYAVDFSFSAISDAGAALSWIGYWTSKSLQQSGDPTDYIWIDLDADVPASSISLYYTESTSLLPDIGNPTYPGAGITWTSFSGSTPASAFWVATQYTINGTKTPWRIIPVRTKQSDFGLIVYTISGRDRPVMNDSVWRADAIAAISSFTGRTYSTTNEMGYGTTIGITYDDGKLFGMLKKVSEVATWVATSTFIDGELLISETIIADKIAANAITTAKLNADSITAAKIAANAVTADAIAAGSITSSKLVVSGTGAIGPGTIGAVTTFYATSAPTAIAVGDLWVDTDDNNRLYRASATGTGNWVSVRDATIATAQTAANTAVANAATAQGTADGKVTTFFATSAPTAEGTGDLWMDTDDGNKLYRWSSSAWVAVQDGAIATAISNAATAQSTADGKIVTFYQTSAPTATSVGDMWVDTDDKNKLYRASATGTGNWVSVQDSTVADNIYSSGETTIDGGKITTLSVDTAQLTANAITVAKIDLDGQLNVTADSGSIAWGKTDGDDVANTGLFIGRNSSGNPRIVFGNSSSYVWFDGTLISVVGADVDDSSGTDVVILTNTSVIHTYTIGPSIATISIELSGGGGGGGGPEGVDGSQAGGTGSTTYVYVKQADGSARATFSAAGGAGGAAGGGTSGVGTAGQAFTHASATEPPFQDVAGGAAVSGNTNGLGGNAYSTGGGGAGNGNADNDGGAGGSAGSYASSIPYSVVSTTDYLQVVVGAGGAGGTTTSDNAGGAGGPGVVRLQGAT